MESVNYTKALALLKQCSTKDGFVASAENISNYKRVWARDGVICGLAALASRDKDLISTFKNTIHSLANNQHYIGTIPSNILFKEKETDVSYGGLAGRVDAVTWFIIGVCQLAYYEKDASIVNKYQNHINKGLELLEAWEFNNKHLMYVPLSGNWADEYITDGYVLYDQLLRLWALKSYHYFNKTKRVANKIECIQFQIEANFFPNSTSEKFHEKAFKNIKLKDYLPCSFSPSGYKTQFDAFANSLLLLLNVGSKSFQDNLIQYAFNLSKSTKLGLIPAFWPPILPKDEHWNLLKDNCKYEFRNYPNEFHNGGSWPMVNGFFGMALSYKSENSKASSILKQIEQVNAVDNYSFFENFNTDTTQPNGVPYCAWSGAAAILLNKTINSNFKLLV
ncbi:glucosidase family protein [Aurantibacter aestuarii]|uniref:Fructofuranosidase/invertase n=1 Tax=Aurantibacter aestuarii TaxID=1266046 RepID=A0A2T1NDY5_9FLAO|nr:fructofuranosidase/invertase [Aurantibacter aestuarii]PSG90640.1 fructofuranosidase/invertase [Aurantibacter aestuarii]